MRPRIPNNGPPMTLADIWPILAGLSEYNSRSVNEQAYTAAASVGPTLAALATQVVTTPTEAAPTGYGWALRAEFTGNCVILAPSNNSLFVLQLEVLSALPSTFVQLSETESGQTTMSLLTAEVPAVGQYESIGLHCTRLLEDLPLPLAATQTVRVAWGIQGVGSSARFQSGGEAQTGGWDLTVKWVLEPVVA